MKIIKLFFFLVFIYILSTIEYEVFIENISDIKVEYLLLAWFLNFFIFFIKNYRWQVILTLQKIEVSFKDLYGYYFASLFIGLVTPGRLGEFSKVIYLRQKTQISYGKLFSSVFLDRVFDLYILLIISLIAIAVLIFKSISLLFLFLSAMILIHSVYFYSLAFRQWIKKMIEKLVDKFSQKIKSFLNDFAFYTKKILSLKNIASLSLYTVLAYLVFFIQIYLIALSVGIEVSIIVLSLIITLSNIISLLPISISGIGTRELTLLYFLTPMQLDTNMIILFSLTILMVSNIGCSLIGLVYFLQNKLSMKNLTKSFQGK